MEVVVRIMRVEMGFIVSLNGGSLWNTFIPAAEFSLHPDS